MAGKNGPPPSLAHGPAASVSLAGWNFVEKKMN